MLVKRTRTFPNTAVADADANNANKKVIFKNCAPFTKSIIEINSTQVDNAKDIVIVMPMMYTLKKYSNNYSKTCRSLHLL